MRSRILGTFAAYFLIIIIPTSILLYHGHRAISLQRKQLEISLFSDLERLRGQIYQDLANQWLAFRELERGRSFYDFLPIAPAPADSPYLAKTRFHVRSPLQFLPHHFSEVLRALNEASLNTGILPGAESGPSGRLFENCLVGYFEYGPQNQRLSTPYAAEEAMPLSPRLELDRFQTFLTEHVLPELRRQANLIPNQFDARSVLLQLKTRRILKFEEPQSSIRELLLENKIDPRGEGLPDHQAVLAISTYDYTFFHFDLGETSFVCGFRVVLMDERILLQGFVLSTFLLLQEAQSYLETFQPDYGDVLITTPPSQGDHAMFEPFANLAISFKPHEEAGSLTRYREERNRFWLMAAFLFLALAGSMTHMANLILAEKELTNKKRDFVSAVTHELKAPLTSIRMYAEMLEEGWAKGKEKLYYHYIQTETHRLTRLVQNVLDFARIERGEFSLVPKPVNLADLVEETVRAWTYWMEEHGMSLIFHAGSRPEVLVDADSIVQVIYNLCDNSLKYGKTGEDPTLTFSVQVEGGEAVLIAYDNGPGVPPEEEEHIFQRFYRCGNEMTREQAGTGLGLALVREIVEQNGGTVNLHPVLKSQGFALRMAFPLLKTA